MNHDVAATLRLDKELDLRNLADVEELIKVVSTQHQAVKLPPDDIKKGFSSLAHHFPSAQWLKLSPYMGGNLIVPTGPKSSRNYPIDHAAQLGLQLEYLKDCDGFSDFLTGFANPTQFFDSVFEAAVANYCLPKVSALRFSPGYIVKGKAKHPDFEVISSYGTVVCECKSASNAERQYVKKFHRLCTAIDSTIKKSGGIPDSLRLEVKVYQKLDRDVGQLGRQIARLAVGTGGTNLQGVIELGPCQVSLVPRNSPTVSNGFGIHHLSIVVGNKPVGITPEYAYLHVTSGRIIKPLIKAAGNLIREAKSQLPETQWCVIFIETNYSLSARRAANLRLGIPDYSHVLACGISSPDGLQFVHRTSRQQIVEDLFGPIVDNKVLTT